MSRYFAAVCTLAILFVSVLRARAAEGDAKSILDKAIKAMGGEEKLAKVEAYSWKAKGTVNFNGNENESHGEVTVKGLDHFRREFGNDQFTDRDRPRRRQGLAQVRRQPVGARR